MTYRVSNFGGGYAVKDEDGKLVGYSSNRKDAECIRQEAEDHQRHEGLVFIILDEETAHG